MKLNEIRRAKSLAEALFVTWTRCLFALLLVLGELGEQREVTAQSERSAFSLGLFSYVHDTLSAFEATGRLEPNPGIDGADIEAFVALFESYRTQFAAIEGESCESFERLSFRIKANIEQEFGTRVAEEILLISQALPPPRC